VVAEIYFDECYHTNPLVNAMSVGIVKAVKQFLQLQKEK
jgi:phosphoribosylformylglycinamidine synthase